MYKESEIEEVHEFICFIVDDFVVEVDVLVFIMIAPEELDDIGDKGGVFRSVFRSVFRRGVVSPDIDMMLITKGSHLFFQ
jgi:hypothetical protein